MKVTAVLGGMAAFGVVYALAAQGVAQQIEERYQYERTHTETTTHTPAPPAAPVVIEKQVQAPPVVIEKQSPPVVIERNQTQAVPVPQAMREGQQVSLTGSIVEVDGDDDELVLAHNGQRILVDTDDLSTNPVDDGPRLRPGDQITVHGKVEDINHSRVKVTAKSIDVLGRNQAMQTVR
jgi:uncharacterized protein YdeI (BOF family)